MARVPDAAVPKQPVISPFLITQTPCCGTSTWHTMPMAALQSAALKLTVWSIWPLYEQSHAQWNVCCFGRANPGLAVPIKTPSPKPPITNELDNRIALLP
jgi:hypothetical protein